MLLDLLLIDLTQIQDPMLMLWLVLHPLTLLASWLGSLVKWPLLEISLLLCQLPIQIQPPIRPLRWTHCKLLHPKILSNQEVKRRIRVNPRDLILSKMDRKPMKSPLRDQIISPNSLVWYVKRIISLTISIDSPRFIYILSEVDPLLNMWSWPILFPLSTNKWFFKILDPIIEGI